MMNESMNTIEKLTAELCPDGVEYFELHDLFEIKNGYTPSKNSLEYWKNGTLPWFRMEDIRKNGRILSDSIQHITEKAVKGKLYPAYSIIMATTATIGEHALIIADSLANQQFTFLTRKVNRLDCLNPKFVYYYCFLLGEWCRNNTNISGFASVDMGKFKKYKFPVPPLPIQEEIVKILDTFTTLEAELEAELEARKKQYEYYREELLTFGDDVEWKTLGEVGTLIRGNGLQKKDFVEEGVGCIHYGQVYTYYGTSTNATKSFVSPELANILKKVNKGDLVITSTSENIDDVCKAVAWLGEDEIVTGGHATILKHHENPKYLSYYFQTTSFSEQKRKYAKGTKVIDVSGSDLAKIKIPIPPSAEQERIVSILDKFDALVNDISVGLPAELNARRKQYEYYREKLLTFKPLGN
ncbi:restriction modification system DNA specificity domain protein [Dehalogenimonas lykanthroporepellens BL-DC-9]|nr:restriction modification system DNA specificity domain protein [Dehalogenimonas lykanthroporepellens BL-DC-9]